MRASGIEARLAHDGATTDFEALTNSVGACTACPNMAHSHVLGHANGSRRAHAIFIAEAVGRRGGAITGIPLTRDESGTRFTAFLALAGLHRDDVFVTNAVLCNPIDAAGRNRPPTPAEVARCRPYLARTLELVRAPYVITLGRVALESIRAIAPHPADLARDTATPVAWNGRTLIPMYHPSRQSTLHRAQIQQEADWRRLGALISPQPTYQGRETAVPR